MPLGSRDAVLIKHKKTITRISDSFSMFIGITHKTSEDLSEIDWLTNTPLVGSLVPSSIKASRQTLAKCLAQHPYKMTSTEDLVMV